MRSAYFFYSRFYKLCLSEKIQSNVNNLAQLCYISILSQILIIFDALEKTGKNFMRNGQFLPEKLIFKVKKYVRNRSIKKVLKLTTLTTFCKSRYFWHLFVYPAEGPVKKFWGWDVLNILWLSGSNVLEMFLTFVYV